MVSVKFNGAKELERGLNKFARKLAAEAARDAVNETAFAARKIWIGEIERSMTLRNRYTVGSVRVEKARRAPIDRIEARLGSYAPYMLAQEEGAPQQLGGRRAIPTSAAAGQQGAIPRTKPVRAPFRLPAIDAVRARGKTRQQRNAATIGKARDSGQKFVLLERARGKGIFRIGGGKRNPKIVMLWDLSRRSTPVPRNPTLQRTVAEITPRAPSIYARAVARQLKRALGRGLRT